MNNAPKPEPGDNSIDLPWAVVAFMVAINVAAVLDWPYGYFQFLRLANTGFAIFMAYRLFLSRPGILPWAFCAVAVIFNPVLPLAFEREIWMLIDLAAAAFFAITGMLKRRL
ncbi:DUF6804 family protein [Croceicoccus gelatinilyticus]|uniref:DUF6804 family protein n=1 Tax=Croceicoccus gelatinilyticus TaxID=2835536 RepID=UPI001BCEA731|nr:DUF6804 family protein [Croceicoccus gelatinilyticus]MBS7671720.1 hypothetical protein [Croceicoccus gelatinilyticus]